MIFHTIFVHDIILTIDASTTGNITKSSETIWIPKLHDNDNDHRFDIRCRFAGLNDMNQKYLDYVC